MAGRKTALALRLGGQKRARVAARADAESTAHVPGVPPRPRGFTDTQYRAWSTLTEKYGRVLYRDDGPKLVAIMAARAEVRAGVPGAVERVSGLLAELDGRLECALNAPVSATTGETALSIAPSPAGVTLSDFIGAVKAERATFDNRRVPGHTVVYSAVNATGPWVPGSAAAIAHDYCDDVICGKVDACELTRRACARHLDDLKHGAERGLFYDTVAAENIRTWFEVFCGIPLQPWEVWLLTSVFAWKKVTGFRRFREAWLSIARKNGKTAISGGVGLFGLIADQEKYAEVYSAATKKDQAQLAFRAARRMRDAHPELKEYVGKQVNSLFIEDTDSFFQPLSADTRSTDGLNPHIVLADELHEWAGRAYWDKLQTALVNRKQPLMFATTTAGDNLESFAAMKEEVGEKLLTGVFPNDDLYVAIFRMEREDSYKDATKWIRANPNLGVSVQPDALRAQLAEVEEDPTKLNAMLRYHCNQWVTLRAGCTFPTDRIDACRGAEFEGMSPKQIREWFEEYQRGISTFRAVAGFDYGEVSDMCCFALLLPNVQLAAQQQAKQVALPFFFMPEKNLLQKEKLWRVPLTTWAREGWIQLLRGDLADPMEIQPHIEQICSRFRILGCGFDRWGGVRSMMADLTQRRVLKTKEIPQHAGFLSTPSKEFKMAVLKGQFAHLDNPVLKWHLSNVELESDARTGGMVPCKANDDPNKKIDGVSAIINAWYLTGDDDFKASSIKPRIFTIP